MNLAARVAIGGCLIPMFGALAACGGSGGGNGSKGSHSIGGTVSGLSGSGLVLTDNGSDSFTVTGNGNFTFAKSVTDGNAFNVQVGTQPNQPAQTCTVAHGSGTLSGSDITNVAVTCTTNSYSVAGTVTGMSGSGLVLANDGGNNLTVSSNGAFTFTIPVASGVAYGVTVATQPTNPPQTCAVTNASGTVTSANITNVAVSCTTNTYSVVAYVSGLTGTGLTLTYNGSTPVTVSRNGPTVLASAQAIGTAYTVAIAGQPASPVQTCVLSTGGGTVGTANVTSINIYCPKPVGRLAYVVSNGDPGYGSSPVPGTIALYAIDSTTGALAGVPGSTVSTGPVIGSFQLVPNSHFAWALNIGDDQASFPVGYSSGIYAYTVDSTTGLLTPATGNPFTDLNGYAGAPGCKFGGYGDTTAVTFAPSGTFGYASNIDHMGSPNAGVWQFTVDPTTGQPHLVMGSEVTALCESPGPVTIDPSGRFAYGLAFIQVASPVNTSAGLFSFSIDPNTGALTELIGSPIDTQTSGRGNVVTDPAGRFAYANLGGAFQIFDIDFSSGQLTPGSPFVLTSDLSGVTIEPRGHFAYLSTTAGISIYSIDPSTGALTAAPGAASIPLTYATALQIDPSGQFAYVTAGVGTSPPSQKGIYAYTLNATTGALTSVAGSPFDVGSVSGAVAVIN